MESTKYSLRWNNHQTHLLHAFEGLLNNETLVDVTLVTQEETFRAHKVVLSACSPYFQRIFCDTPCKHPVIVLKDVRGWEMQAIVDFMYKGEISVGHEQLASLINAAESLQVRGLAHTDHIPVENGDNSGKPGSVSSVSSNGPGFSSPIPPSQPVFPSTSPISTPYDVPLPRLPQMPIVPNINFNDQQPQSAVPAERNCHSPLPRRKQARPRRRSGEVPQDLSKNSAPSDNEMAENLSLKKSSTDRFQSHNRESPIRLNVASPRINSAQSLKADSEESDLGDSLQGTPMELNQIPNHLRQLQNNMRHFNHMNDNHHMPLIPHRMQELQENAASHLPPLSGLPLNPPHMFPLDAHLGLFPPFDRGFLLNDILDQRHDSQPISHKKNKMCRPKGQHSAPRGGPPRSWTNAELTEALQHVWNKKMTTSQASRIFGIPYNSLLMYVRGKYGKSLKLEKLKQECFGDNISSLDLLGFNNNNNSHNNNNNNNNATNTNTNNNKSGKIQQQPEPSDLMLPPNFNATPYPSPNFYPDFGASFPVPVGMMHLLPPPHAEKLREQYHHYHHHHHHADVDAYGVVGGGGGGVSGLGKDRSNSAPVDYNNKHEGEQLCGDVSPLDYAKDEGSAFNDVKMEEAGSPTGDEKMEDMLQRQLRLVSRE